MKDKALTHFILAAALSTTLFQLSGGIRIAQLIVVSILGISAPILWIGQNIKWRWWIRVLHIVDSIEIKMTAAGFSLSSVGLAYFDIKYILVGAIFLLIGAPLFGIGIADNIRKLKKRVYVSRFSVDQEKILMSKNKFDQESAAKFLITEYQQSFSHMRHYDKTVLSLSRYLFTFFAAIYTASIALYQYLANMPYQNMVIGIISLLALLVGVIFLLLILKNRLYYTTVARQVNSIRNYFLNNMCLDFSQYNLSYTNPDEPRLWNIFSSYTLLYFIAALVNATLAGSSYLFLYASSKGTAIVDIWLSGLVVTIAAFVLEIVVMTIYFSNQK